jgi:DNA-binding NarL/FixJ family response regulator
VHETVERAVVVDELALARLGMASVLESQGVEVIAETHSGREAASVATLEGPDLVVLGRPADLSVTDTVRRLARVQPMPGVVALVAPGQEDSVAYLVALGTRGVALRAGTVEELGGVIASALKGTQVVVPALQSSLAGSVTLRAVDTGPELLSAREREVLACLAQGRSNREIAAALSVTLATVKSHLVRIYAKLEAGNRNEALGRAVALGLLS